MYALTRTVLVTVPGSRKLYFDNIKLVEKNVYSTLKQILPKAKMQHIGGNDYEITVSAKPKRDKEMFEDYEKALSLMKLHFSFDALLV